MPRTRVLPSIVPGSAVGTARRQSASTHVIRQTFLGWLVLLPLAAPARAAEGPEDDDWTLERDNDDERLVATRLGKLRKYPFDRPTWRALERAIGASRLGQRIEAAHARDPDDLALAVLSARARMAAGQPRVAAERLANVQTKAGKLRPKVVALWVEALVAAGNVETATTVLVDEAGRSNDPALARKHLTEAHELAQRGQRSTAALRIAEQLVAASPRAGDAWLRLARTAARAGEHEKADDAFEHALAIAAVPEVVHERAGARLDARDPAGAADLLWPLVDGSSGDKHQRQIWWSTLAEAHRRAGRAAQLVQALEHRVTEPTHAREARAFVTLARAREWNGDDPLSAWRTAVSLDPGDLETRHALVLALESRGDLDAAVDETKRMLERSHDEAGHALELAARLMSSGHRELGATIARDIELRMGRHAHPLMLLLDFYNSNEDPDRALDIAKRLVSAHPRDPDARIALGEQLYQMNRVDEAIREWGFLPKLIRPSHLGWARYAEVLSEHGGGAQALVPLAKALEAAPREPRYLRLRAVLEEEKRADAAYATWQQVRMLAKGSDHGLLRDEARTRAVELLVARDQDGQGRDLAMRAEHQAKLTLRRGVPVLEAIEAGRFLVELYTRKELYVVAAAVAREVVQLASDDRTLLAELAASERRAGQLEQAIATLERLAVMDPKRSGEVLAELSEVAFEAGDIDGALAAAAHALHKDPAHVSALVRVGELHERKGDLERAEQAYLDALKHVPSDPLAQLRLAELSLTRGNTRGASQRFRAILEHGGSPEVIRAAGRRALDLAEATESTAELVALAIHRTKLDPDEDESREFLLDTLERARLDDIEQWLRTASGVRDATRVTLLRRPLVDVLARGPVGMRLRAAEHLGRLKLPDTAVALARMGVQLTPPRDATAAVAQMFEHARATALRAAGSMDDADAVPVLAEVVAQARSGPEVKQAAVWALAANSSERALDQLRVHTQAGSDRFLAALACIALAKQSSGGSARGDRARVARLARDGGDRTLRHMCAYADAALRTDHELAPLYEQLKASDPMLAAIAAWRLGRTVDASEREAALEHLLTRFLGPNGLARDAAAAAVAALLTNRGESREQVANVPPPPRGRAWATVLQRWLQARIAPPYASVPVRTFEPFEPVLRRALSAARYGTRADRAATAAARSACAQQSATSTASHADGERICLSPLIDGAVVLSPMR